MARVAPDGPPVGRVAEAQRAWRAISARLRTTTAECPELGALLRRPARMRGAGRTVPNVVETRSLLLTNETKGVDIDRHAPGR